METLETILLILLVTDALALAGLVLLQQGKGADIGAAFGSGSANTLFGAEGSVSFLAKATSWLAIGFFVISFGLAYAGQQKANILRGPTDILEQTLDAEVPAEMPQRDGDIPAGDDLPRLGDDLPELTPPQDALDSDIPDV